MKQKTFKIKTATLLVYASTKSNNHSPNETEPTTSLLTTSVTSTGIFNAAK